MQTRVLTLGLTKDTIVKYAGPLTKKKGKSMKYYVFYVKDCVPKVKEHLTLSKALAFFKKLSNSQDEDNWVDFLIKGDFLVISEMSDHLSKDLKLNSKQRKLKAIENF